VASTKAYPREFKEDAVRLYRSSGKSIKAISTELGIATESLRKGVKQSDLDSGSRTDGLTSDERDELRRLRRENRTLLAERDILKRAAAFFAQESGSRSR
jgi:transposase